MGLNTRSTNDRVEWNGFEEVTDEMAGIREGSIRLFRMAFGSNMFTFDAEDSEGAGFVPSEQLHRPPKAIGW
jgi:hypothetical protein